jgi:hypothetical protein
LENCRKTFRIFLRFAGTFREFFFKIAGNIDELFLKTPPLLPTVEDEMQGFQRYHAGQAHPPQGAIPVGHNHSKSPLKSPLFRKNTPKYH